MPPVDLAHDPSAGDERAVPAALVDHHPLRAPALDPAMPATDPVAVVGSQVDIGPARLATDPEHAGDEIDRPRRSVRVTDPHPGPGALSIDEIRSQIQFAFHGPGPTALSTVPIMDELAGSHRSGDDHGGARPQAIVIPRYEITAMLGRGAFGVVYRAWQPAFHRDVAIKVLMDPSTSATPPASSASARPWARRRRTPTSSPCTKPASRPTAGFPRHGVPRQGVAGRSGRARRRT